MCCTDRGHFSALLLSSGDGAGELFEILRAAGIATLHVAFDQRAALAVLHNRPIDMVVCDGDASWSGSLATARRVRAMPHESHSHLPIVVLASDAPVQKVVAARNAGVHQVMHKRMSAGELARELCDLLTRPRPFVRDGGYFGPTRAAFVPTPRSFAEADIRP